MRPHAGDMAGGLAVWGTGCRMDVLSGLAAGWTCCLIWCGGLRVCSLADMARMLGCQVVARQIGDANCIFRWHLLFQGSHDLLAGLDLGGWSVECLGGKPAVRHVLTVSHAG